MSTNATEPTEAEHHRRAMAEVEDRTLAQRNAIISRYDQVMASLMATYKLQKTELENAQREELEAHAAARKDLVFLKDHAALEELDSAGEELKRDHAKVRVQLFDHHRKARAEKAEGLDHELRAFDEQHTEDKQQLLSVVVQEEKGRGLGMWGRRWWQGGGVLVDEADAWTTLTLELHVAWLPLAEMFSRDEVAAEQQAGADKLLLRLMEGVHAQQNAEYLDWAYRQVLKDVVFTGLLTRFEGIQEPAARGAIAVSEESLRQELERYNVAEHLHFISFKTNIERLETIDRDTLLAQKKSSRLYLLLKSRLNFIASAELEGRAGMQEAEGVAFARLSSVWALKMDSLRLLDFQGTEARAREALIVSFEQVYVELRSQADEELAVVLLGTRVAAVVGGEDSTRSSVVEEEILLRNHITIYAKQLKAQLLSASTVRPQHVEKSDEPLSRNYIQEEEAWFFGQLARRRQCHEICLDELSFRSDLQLKEGSHRLALDEEYDALQTVLGRLKVFHLEERVRHRVETEQQFAANRLISYYFATFGSTVRAWQQLILAREELCGRAAIEEEEVGVFVQAYHEERVLRCEIAQRDTHHAITSTNDRIMLDFANLQQRAAIKDEERAVRLGFAIRNRRGWTAIAYSEIFTREDEAREELDDEETFAYQALRRTYRAAGPKAHWHGRRRDILREALAALDQLEEDREYDIVSLKSQASIEKEAAARAQANREAKEMRNSHAIGVARFEAFEGEVRKSLVVNAATESFAALQTVLLGQESANRSAFHLAYERQWNITLGAHTRSRLRFLGAEEQSYRRLVGEEQVEYRTELKQLEHTENVHVGRMLKEFAALREIKRISRSYVARRAIGERRANRLRQIARELQVTRREHMALVQGCCASIVSSLCVKMRHQAAVCAIVARCLQPVGRGLLTRSQQLLERRVGQLLARRRLVLGAIYAYASRALVGEKRSKVDAYEARLAREKDDAAFKIQWWFNGLRARRMAASTIESTRVEQLSSLAAVCIQTAARRMLAKATYRRKRMERMHHMISAVQRAGRGHIYGRKKLRRIHFAHVFSVEGTVVQCFLRALTSRVAAKERVSFLAAAAIQRTFRGAQARKTHMLREASRKNRTKYRLSNHAATNIQRVAMGFVGRCKARRLAEVRSARREEHRLSCLGTASEVAQAVGRGFLARLHVDRYRSDAKQAALSIQCMVRCSQARCAANAKRRVRDARILLARQVNTSTMVQKCMRTIAANNRARRWVQATTEMQSTRRYAALVVQRNVRRIHATREVTCGRQEKDTAAQILGLAWRSYCSRKDVGIRRKLRADRHSEYKRDIAACKIQEWVRRRLRQLHRAAFAIQNMFHRRLPRLRITKELERANYPLVAFARRDLERTEHTSRQELQADESYEFGALRRQLLDDMTTGQREVLLTWRGILSRRSRLAKPPKKLLLAEKADRQEVVYAAVGGWKALIRAEAEARRRTASDEVDAAVYTCMDNEGKHRMRIFKDQMTVRRLIWETARNEDSERAAHERDLFVAEWETGRASVESDYLAGLYAMQEDHDAAVIPLITQHEERRRAEEESIANAAAANSASATEFAEQQDNLQRHVRQTRSARLRQREQAIVLSRLQRASSSNRRTSESVVLPPPNPTLPRHVDFSRSSIQDKHVPAVVDTLMQYCNAINGGTTPLVVDGRPRLGPVELDLSMNDLTDDGFFLLWRSVPKESLETLVLSDNPKLTDATAQLIVRYLNVHSTGQHQCKLRAVRMTHTKISLPRKQMLEILLSSRTGCSEQPPALNGKGGGGGGPVAAPRSDGTSTLEEVSQLHMYSVDSPQFGVPTPADRALARTLQAHPRRSSKAGK